MLKDIKKADKKAYKGIRIPEDGAYVEAGENDNPSIRNLLTIKMLMVSLVIRQIQTQMLFVPQVALYLHLNQLRWYYPSRGLYVYAKKEHMGVIPGMTEFIELYQMTLQAKTVH